MVANVYEGMKTLKDGQQGCIVAKSRSGFLHMWYCNASVWL